MRRWTQRLYFRSKSRAVTLDSVSRLLCVYRLLLSMCIGLCEVNCASNEQVVLAVTDN